MIRISRLLGLILAVASVWLIVIGLNYINALRISRIGYAETALVGMISVGLGIPLLCLSTYLVFRKHKR